MDKTSKNKIKKEILLANPRGFCAGVERAIEIVEKSLEKYDCPVFVRHHVVHNKKVVENLESKGVTFVKEVDEIPDESIAIFSAHGVPEDVEISANSRNFKYFDATCPLVTKVHLEVKKHAKQGRDIVLIGHKGHPEVVGTLGRHPKHSNTKIILVETENDVKSLNVNGEKLAFVTQTTLSVDETKEIISALKKKFPKIVGPNADDICYATQNRQDAVKQLSLESDLVIVIGSKSSSNSNRLKELAEKCGTASCLIDGYEDFNTNLLEDKKVVGITAGASAPEYIVDELIAFLSKFDFKDVRNLSKNNENVNFKLPRELQ
jgi:4-hydroxy-3-methylbut-2-enyl diphosphate reductase